MANIAEENKNNSHSRISFRYFVYCIEYGYPPHNPFFETADRQEADIIAHDLAFNNQVRVYVVDRDRGLEVTVYIGNKK